MDPIVPSICSYCKVRGDYPCNHGDSRVRTECNRQGFPSPETLARVVAGEEEEAPPRDLYVELRKVLAAALAQAASGKGMERHGNSEPWENQRWARVSREVGPGFMLGQAIKKIGESQGFTEAERIERELLGAMNYIAMAIYYYNQRG